jgi:hypothetical protein
MYECFRKHPEEDPGREKSGEDEKEGEGKGEGKGDVKDKGEEEGEEEEDDDEDDEKEAPAKWQLLDMDMRAYSHATGLMVGYGNFTFGQRFSTGPKAQGIEMACGRQGHKSTEAHKVVHLPRTHPLFRGEGLLSEISMVFFSPSKASDFWRTLSLAAKRTAHYLGGPYERRQAGGRHRNSRRFTFAAIQPCARAVILTWTYQSSVHRTRVSTSMLAPISLPDLTANHSQEIRLMPWSASAATTSSRTSKSAPRLHTSRAWTRCHRSTSVTARRSWIRSHLRSGRLISLSGKQRRSTRPLPSLVVIPSTPSRKRVLVLSVWV